MKLEKQSKIEKKKARRAARQEEWKQTVPEEKKKEIEKRLAEGAQRSLEKKEQRARAQAEAFAEEKSLRAARDKRLEGLKAGHEFNETNKTVLFKGEIFGYSVTAGALLRTGPERAVYYAIAYTICSHKDWFSRREGCDRVGMRLLEGTQGKAHPYSFEINLARRGALSPVRLAMLIHAHIVMDVVSRRTRTPEKMERVARRWSKRGWAWGNQFSPYEDKKKGGK
jgi:hypothetical protein